MANRSVKVLVVDDDPDMRMVLEIRLQHWGFDVQLASDGSEAKALAESYNPDIILADVVMPGVSGLELIGRLRADNQDCAIILMTAHTSVDTAVEAMKQGALDYVTKPLDYSKLKLILDSIQEDFDWQRHSSKLTARLEKGAGFGLLIGLSKPMKKVYNRIKSLAGNEAPAIITGESGTGKELVARMIHQLSPRSEGPFIAINASALPENLIESELFGHEKGAFTDAAARRQGCFEMAHNGTLFLDEIAEMPMALQPKLLRVLETRSVRRLGGNREIHIDVHVIAATNQHPDEAIEKERLRQDLYYRLNVFTITIPPLRDRHGDIPLLVQHFIGQFNQKHQTSVRAVREDALAMLEKYPWPGNVRELRNVMERAVILTKGGWIETSYLPAYIQNAQQVSTPVVIPIGVTAAEAEKEFILKTLEQVGNNESEAARRLGLDLKTIRNKLARYAQAAGAGQEG